MMNADGCPECGHDRNQLVDSYKDMNLRRCLRCGNEWVE